MLDLETGQSLQEDSELKRKPRFDGRVEGLEGGCEHLRLGVTNVRHSTAVLKL